MNNTPLEKEEQENFINYCHSKNIRVISTQNGVYLGGGSNRFAIMRTLKRTGLSVGFPDLIVLEPTRNHQCLFLEMKRQKGGVISQEQKEWITWLDGKGYAVAVAKGCDSAIRILNMYLSDTD